MKAKLVFPTESGVVSAFVLGLMMTFVVCAGLGVDGGRLVANRLELADHAENAARVGAQELTDLRTGEPIIDENQAQYSASNYLATHDIDGEVSTTFNSVTVTVSRDIAMSLLKLFGATNHQITVTRIAKPSDQ
ncbi:MAG: pilus assembly protein TadG-related protein [Acidimicrobiaceae bacterium]